MFSSFYTALNHLPVTAIAEDVARKFSMNKIPVVTSQVASGKTMLIPAHCADYLRGLDGEDDVIVVLQPTRFLANNAADSMRDLLGEDGDHLIGCINSKRSDDESTLHEDNRIILTTVGYALSSGMLDTHSNFILDEAHETSIDLSLTKAILKHRRDRGDDVKIAVLSATLDLTNEMDYWGEDAYHFETEGSAFPVDMLHRPASGLDAAVQSLITDHQRKGILVFVAGVQEIEEAINDISGQLGDRYDFEIMGVHGNSTGPERRAASKAPHAAIKILVGTNVLESGVSLPWVDAGVSSGKCKVMHVSGNAKKLVVEDLPAWRIKQQMGRVGRFCPGVFVLADSLAQNARPMMALPDIVRLPLTELVMHCASLKDIHLSELRFTKKEMPHPERLRDAIDTLVGYGFVDETEDGGVELTEEGLMIQSLPVSYRAGAAYCEAVRMNQVATMLPLIAMIDTEDLRQIMREPLSGPTWRTSDLVAQIRTLVEIQRQTEFREYTFRDACEIANISMKKVKEYDLLLTDLEKKTGVYADFSPYKTGESEEERHLLDRQTKRVIFRAMLSETYLYHGFGGTTIPSVSHNGFVFTGAKPSNTTVVQLGFGAGDTFALAGNLRVIIPKKSFQTPFVVLESLTAFTKEDFKVLIEEIGENRVRGILRAHPGNPVFRSWFQERDYAKEREMRNERYDIGASLGDVLGDMLVRRKHVEHAPVPDPTPEEKTKASGTFGDLLSAAMTNKY